MPSWADLNERHQESLQEIYNQEHKRYERVFNSIETAMMVC